MATEITFGLDERQSGRYTATLVDEVGDPVPLAAIDSMVMTLYDVLTGTIINSRDQQNVLNQNQVTYGATDGALAWYWLPVDQAILDPEKVVEQHIALIVVKWSGTTKQTDFKIIFNVNNVNKLP